MASTTSDKATPQRRAELLQNLAETKICFAEASKSLSHAPTLVAVSKTKPAWMTRACYEEGQRDFGENSDIDLVNKAKKLADLDNLRWHFIGVMKKTEGDDLRRQARMRELTTVSNLHAIQSLTSTEDADIYNNAIPADRKAPLNMLLQVNTSGEVQKSGLQYVDTETEAADSPLFKLACHIIEHCPKLHFQGLMTIGSQTESLASSERPNQDFETLKKTRDVLEGMLRSNPTFDGRWGDNGKLLLSMGMTADFEAGLRAGSHIVRVGTGIFGARRMK
ncbi:uncharacterized protein F5147DRAFT_745259 [Suillus discolor]|uniref:Pyridoxal phosphate homeostasis protein n=1 Tax=Suillus discolor TaxID=1912936 RepID=A0A9P7JUS3_9AGAM|nr:uncharacterized protein F5147DRAFT_745259 [Suillus discolor]KAG2110285.1 hypothetical protein F5147DRAFT_745259 [Suillus discolor]